MGDWDVSAFGNDEARDWLAELVQSTNAEPIFRALVAAAKIRPGQYMQAPECERAIAAAEIVACARGGIKTTTPGDLKNWLQDQKFVAGDRIAVLAMQVLDRITTDSELKQVWDDTDSSKEWYESIADLKDRLSEEDKDPMGKEDADVESVEKLCEQAAVLVAEQKHAQALELYDRATAVDSGSQMVYMGRAVCHLWMGKSDKVIEDINKALSVGRPIPDAYQLRSQAFYYLKKYKQVIADLSSYLRVRPNHAESYYIRGLAYMHENQFQNAIADLTYVIDRPPSDNMVEALNFRANCYEQLGRPDLGAHDRFIAAQIAAAAEMQRTAH